MYGGGVGVGVGGGGVVGGGGETLDDLIWLFTPSKLSKISMFLLLWQIFVVADFCTVVLNDLAIHKSSIMRVILIYFYSSTCFQIYKICMHYIHQVAVKLNDIKTYIIIQTFIMLVFLFNNDSQVKSIKVYYYTNSIN